MRSLARTSPESSAAPSARARRSMILGPAIVAGALLGACTQTTVVKSKPWFAGLPNATGNVTPTGDMGPTPSVLTNASGRLETQDDKGERTLVIKNGRALMIHIYTALMNDDRETFEEQILSAMTRQEFLANGRDPREAFDMLLAMEGDIIDLFNTMPFAEGTPGLRLQPVGEGVQRVRVRGLQAGNLRLVGMDMVMEKANWRLRWFVPAR